MGKAADRISKGSNDQKHFRGHSCDIVPFTEISWYKKYRENNPGRIVVSSHDVNHMSVSMEKGHLVTAGCGIRGAVPDVNQDPAVFDICATGSSDELAKCLKDLVAERLKNDLAVAKKLVEELMKDGRIEGEDAEELRADLNDLNLTDFLDWLLYEGSRKA